MASASATPRLGPVIASCGALYHQHRAAQAAGQLACGLRVELLAELAWPSSVSALVSSPQPTQSSIGFVECGSLNIWEKKNSRKPL